MKRRYLSILHHKMSEADIAVIFNNNQVFMVDLSVAESDPKAEGNPVLLADLPEGRGPDGRGIDK